MTNSISTSLKKSNLNWGDTCWAQTQIYGDREQEYEEPKYCEAFDYEICLIGWYYGIDPREVKLEDYSVEDFAKAENFMIEQHMDVVAFWNGDED